VIPVAEGSPVDARRAVVLSIMISLAAFVVLVGALAIGLGGVGWGGYLCVVSGGLALAGAGLSLWATTPLERRRLEVIASASYALLMNLGVLAGSVAVALDVAGVV
jgi:hypothetical protein